MNNLTNGKDPEGNIPFEVTAAGSLGLLALGAIGIKAWRKKREEEKLKSNSEAKK